MKEARRAKTGLVVEHVEGISRTAIRLYPEIITEFARGRSGVYALYNGRIRSIKPWRDTGKYIVLLRGKAKRIGPISFSPKVNIQAPRLALMARLMRAHTLADAL